MHIYDTICWCVVIDSVFQTVHIMCTVQHPGGTDVMGTLTSRHTFYAFCSEFVPSTATATFTQFVESRVIYPNGRVNRRHLF